MLVHRRGPGIVMPSFLTSAPVSTASWAPTRMWGSGLHSHNRPALSGSGKSRVDFHPTPASCLSFPSFFPTEVDNDDATAPLF